MKNKSLLSIEKNIIKWEKKVWSSLYETIILQNNALEKSFDEEWKDGF